LKETIILKRRHLKYEGLLNLVARDFDCVTSRSRVLVYRMKRIHVSIIYEQLLK